MRAILGKVVSKMIMNMMSLTAIVKIDDDDDDYSKDGDGNSNDSKKRGLPTGQPALTEQ